MDAEDRSRQAWQRLQQEQQARALRFGPRPEKSRDIKRKLEPLVFGAVSLTPPDELDAYLQTFLPVFRRRDTLWQAELYLMGLLSDLKRKNGETIEAAAPAATQQGVWDFLVRSPWPADQLDQLRVRDGLRRAGCSDQPLDVLMDESGWRKKGHRSVGVGRQYLGSIGKVDNGQVVVSLHGCWGHMDLPLLGELYLPEPWTNDPLRRKQAKIPENRTFQTKPEIALALIDRVRGWGLTLGRMFGDPGYADLDLIQGLNLRNLPFCLGVKSVAFFSLPAQDWLPAVPAPPYSGHGRPRLGTPAQPRLYAAAELRQIITDDRWRKVAYRDGVDGQPLIREFAAVRAHLTTHEQVQDGLTNQGEELWLLLERPCEPGVQPGCKQYVISGPESMTLDELAQIAHRRPIIERNSYENAKQEVGLSNYQGRSWVGFHHHLSMAWLALTFLMLHRRPLPPPSTTLPPSPPPSTLPSPASAPAPPPAGGTVPFSMTLAQPALAPLPRPRQIWESAQEVHRRLVEWFHGMRFRELAFAGLLPPLPSLGSLPAGP